MFAEEMELHCSLCMFLYKILTLVKCMLKSCFLLAVYSPSCVIVTALTSSVK